MRELNNPPPSLKREGGENQLPNPSLERWMYSNLLAYVSGEYTEEPLAVGYKGDENFVVEGDIEITPWAQDAYGDMQLWNGLQDILSLEISEDKPVDNCVEMSSKVLSGIQSSGHLTIVVKKGIKAVVKDHIFVDGWCVRSLFVKLEEGAELTHIRTGDGQGVVTNLIQIEQAAKSKYNGYTLNAYGAFVRDQIHARLKGEGAHCSVSGAKLLSGKQHCDTCILIEHEAPSCYSNQNYRNVLTDQSRGVFQGKVHVHQIAQQTDGYQLCNSMLLSDKCEMDTKPELEIYADDVRCSHGATTAQLDDDPLFYLQARGIPKNEAQKMLLEAFVMESTEAFEDDEHIHSNLEGFVTEALYDAA